MQTPSDWGLPFEALLGAIKIQNDLKLPSIGGKDSMSGTFKDVHVPPMLMAFGITTVDSNKVISTEFKNVNNYVYLVKHNHLAKYLPNIEELKVKANELLALAKKNNSVGITVVPSAAGYSTPLPGRTKRKRTDDSG